VTKTSDDARRRGRKRRTRDAASGRDLPVAVAAFAAGLAGLAAAALGAAWAIRRADARTSPTAPPDPGVDPRPAAPAGPGTSAPTMAAAVNPAAEHSAPDLAPGAAVSADARAPEAFRPDPTAVPTAEEREALRPATGPAPGFAADRGDFASGLARAD